MPTYSLLKSYYNAHLDETDLKSKLNSQYGGSEKWALVTGASEGIGREYAVNLAESGYNLTLVSRSKEKLDKVDAQVRKINPLIKTRVIPFDVSKASPSGYAQLFNKDEQTSIIISNAGIMKNAQFFDTKPATIEAMIKTNFHPHFFLTKYAMNHFSSTNDDFTFKRALVYVSSCVSCMTLPTAATYSGTKTAIAVYCKLASDYCNKSKNWKSTVDFQSVHPGTTTTALNNYELGPHASKPEETS